MPQEMIAAALGLGPHEIGFENHRPALRSAGVPYVTVPVANARRRRQGQARPEALERIRADDRWRAGPTPMSTADETVNHDCHFHARMFAPKSGIPEDPATGSAAAAFSGAVVAFDAPPDGPHVVWIEQGIEMGRPSRIRLEMEIAGGVAVSARNRRARGQGRRGAAVDRLSPRR